MMLYNEVTKRFTLTYYITKACTSNITEVFIESLLISVHAKDINLLLIDILQQGSSLSPRLHCNSSSTQHCHMEGTAR